MNIDSDLTGMAGLTLQESAVRGVLGGKWRGGGCDALYAHWGGLPPRMAASDAFLRMSRVNAGQFPRAAFLSGFLVEIEFPGLG
ncbi:hypothetical protein AB0H69_40260 [Streptomyces phaeochromogenes]|uniref:hypothetical protein n=1 Tax=Streptomyces phaeochromogenes TaxID=1923 RepID=UPI003404BF7B